MLGATECDWETAYFLEHGKYPPVQRHCSKGEVSIRDAIERDWNEPDLQYVMWRGWRIGNLDWIQ